MKAKSVVDLVVATPDEMERLGARIAERLEAGDLVALNGDLGAGKTTLVRGLGAALGVRGTVTSPTFVLARTHPRDSGPPLVHVDAYRLAGALEFDDLDLDFAGSIVVVEWARGLLEGAGESRLEIDIDRNFEAHGTGIAAGQTPRARTGDAGVDTGADILADDAPRLVRITGKGPRWADLSWLAPQARDLS